MSVDGGAAPWPWSGWGSTATGVATVTPAGPGIAVAYRLTEGAAALVPDFAAVRAFALPVVVDPQTAKSAPGGQLVLTIDSATKIAAHVVGTQPRMPTVSGGSCSPTAPPSPRCSTPTRPAAAPPSSG